MGKFRVRPYKQGSRSAKALAEALGGKVLKLNGSKFRPRQGDVVIAWGGDIGNVFAPARVLNPATAAAANKLTSFQKLQEGGVRVPEFTSDQDIAQGWARNDIVIVCRTKLAAHSGEGIVIAEKAEDVVKAPLYTQYVKKKDEYRVHVVGNKAFFIQRKARKLDVENPDWRVRNLAGGFVFTEVGEHETPPDVINQSIASVRALGLDFGGVDVIWNERESQAYVLEVNTACGLEDRTAEKYADAIVSFIQN